MSGCSTGFWGAGPREERFEIGAERVEASASGQAVRARGADRRVGWSFLRKWEGLSLKGGFPSLAEFTAETMGELWPNICIIDVRSGLEEAQFEYCSPVFMAACGAEKLTGKPLSDSLPKALWETMPYAFQAVVNTRKAIISSHHTS